jgi:hypothetical protein
MEMELATFAERVNAAARRCTSGCFGTNKVFIAHVWREMAGELGGMELDRFKRLLVIANNKLLLRLSRADLVGAMDPRDVAESETHYMHAVFHCKRRPARPPPSKSNGCGGKPKREAYGVCPHTA